MSRNSGEVEPDARHDEWPVDMSAIPEYKNVTLYQDVASELKRDAPFRADSVQRRRGDSFLHRLLMLLMGELDD